MFKRKEIDELNARIVELARQVKKLTRENKEQKQITLQELRNNTEILKQNNKNIELIKRITNLVNSNKYNNEKAVLEKIKELISDHQSQN